MKIAYVINSVEGGGAALPVPGIVNALRDCGAEVAVFALTPRDRRAVPAMAAAGIEARVREGGEKDHAAALAWLSRAIAEYRPDIIWTSLTRATLLGQLVGLRQSVPVVSWQHAAYLKPANRRLLRATRRLSALWIADSSAVRDFALRQLRVPEDDLVTWPFFAADASVPRARPWIPGEPVRVASLGRLHPVKGYDVLVEALGQLKRTHELDLHLTIGGTGEEQDRLRDQARAAGLTNVALPGFVDDPAVFLTRQHLYVQPSRSEGFCVAAHEAMQAGLPVIGSAVGEMAFTIEPGVTGALVPPGDAAALAKALHDLVTRPEQLHTLGEAGRERLLGRFNAEVFGHSARAIVQRLDALCRPGR